MHWPHLSEQLIISLVIEIVVTYHIATFLYPVSECHPKSSVIPKPAPRRAIKSNTNVTNDFKKRTKTKSKNGNVHVLFGCNKY